MKQRNFGLLLSYLLLLIDIIIGLFYTPMLIDHLGDGENGLYQLMGATVAYLAILDLGLGSTITRYLLKYKAIGNKKDEENLLAISFLIFAIISFIMLIAGLAIYFNLSFIFPKLSASQLLHAKSMFLLMIINLVVSLFNHVYSGILVAYERFIFEKTVKIIRVLLKFVLVLALITKFKSATYIVAVDLFLTTSILLINILYSRFRLKARIKLHNLDKKLIFELLLFTSLIFGQVIINQFNNNVDKILLGMYSTTVVVSIYSAGMTIFSMFSSLSTVVQTVYFPKISKVVFKNESDLAITKELVAPSRIQLYVLTIAFIGFGFLGKNFISLWIENEDYSVIYTFIMLLFASCIIPFSQNSFTIVLKAKNKLFGKIIIEAAITIGNIVITYLSVRFAENKMLGAALGTSFTYIVGNLIALNIYYKKVIHIDIVYFFKKLFERMLIPLVLTLVVSFLITELYTRQGYLDFGIKALVIGLFYILFVIIFGLNENEKMFVRKLTNKLREMMRKHS